MEKVYQVLEDDVNYGCLKYSGLATIGIDTLGRIHCGRYRDRKKGGNLFADHRLA